MSLNAIYFIIGKISVKNGTKLTEAKSLYKSIVALSPDSQVVVIADGKDLAFFSAENGDKIGAVSGVHAEHITAVVFDKVCG